MKEEERAGRGDMKEEEAGRGRSWSEGVRE